MLLLIDFEKAFDTVSWDFLFDVLDFFNFGNDFKQWIHVFYKNIQSCVIVNGHLSEWFYLQRGCRQGDPLSPYLFILCAEILAALIRNQRTNGPVNAHLRSAAYTNKHVGILWYLTPVQGHFLFSESSIFCPFANFLLAFSFK